MLFADVTACALVIPRGLLAEIVRPDPADDPQVDRKAVEAAAMDAVMRIERAHGYEPTDVSADNCGYDILSRPQGDGMSVKPDKFIEVKGRIWGADKVHVSRNEQNTAVNARENWLLAIVAVDFNENRTVRETETVYLKRPFASGPDPASAGCDFFIKKLREQGEVIHEERETR